MGSNQCHSPIKLALPNQLNCLVELFSERFT